MRDTTDAVALAQLNVYRRLEGPARLRLAFEMSKIARGLALARLRHQHPGWSIDDLHRELLRYSLLPGPVPLPLQ
jgi:hypothetical protein